MANANGTNEKMLQRMNVGNTPIKKEDGIKGLLSSVDVKKRFEEILGKKAAGFMSSIINLTNNNKLLQSADPKTVLAAAAIAASMDLPIDPNLGFAYIVPYNSKEGTKGQFQLG